MSDDQEEIKAPLIERIVKLSPLILLLPQIAGGAVGGICGFIGWHVNTKIFQSEYSTPIKYLLCACSFVFAVVIYLAVMVALYIFFPDLFMGGAADTSPTAPSALKTQSRLTTP